MQQKLSVTTLIIVMALMITSCNNSEPQADIKPISDEVAPATPVETSQNRTDQSSVDTKSADSASENSGQILTFDLTGGPVEFCDTLTIAENGEFLLTQPCKNNTLSGTLVGSDLSSFQTWIQELGSIDLTQASDVEEGQISASLQFRGLGATQADATQETAVFNWINGLVIRMQPPPTVEAPPTPMAVETEGLCPTINKPAILVDNYDSPYQIVAIDATTGETCDIVLEQPPTGKIVSVGGAIYYPVFDETAKTITIWQVSADGSQAPLGFTTVNVTEGFLPFNFVLSADGSKIAWTRTEVDVMANPETPPYRNDLWVANIDGSELVTVMDQVENSQALYLVPIRFSPDGDMLYYALQPNNVSNTNSAFAGRYDSLYAISANGGEPQQRYLCTEENARFCVGDISLDGTVIAYIDIETRTVNLLRTDGSIINSFTAPGNDYVGQPTFSPAGNLAFVSLTFDTESDQFPPPVKPGYLSMVSPPYSDVAQTMLTDDRVVRLWEWVDDDQLAYGVTTEDTFSLGVGVVSIAGETDQLTPRFPLGIWR
ncbi:hypothetical protein QUF64_11425 [Anaerolineales bacterium HSG6]|nr:hypothetical protein [Anaerolineales bacterium HSG6]